MCECSESNFGRNSFPNFCSDTPRSNTQLHAPLRDARPPRPRQNGKSTSSPPPNRRTSIGFSPSTMIPAQLNPRRLPPPCRRPQRAVGRTAGLGSGRAQTQRSRPLDRLASDSPNQNATSSSSRTVAFWAMSRRAVMRCSTWNSGPKYGADTPAVWPAFDLKFRQKLISQAPSRHIAIQMNQPW